MALTPPPEIRIKSAQLNAQDVQVGELMTLLEVRLNVSGLRFSPAPGSGVRVEEASVTLVATEKAINDVLRANPPEGTRDLSLATLSGRVRIEGKVVWNRVPVPFALTASPEVEGGARIHLNVQQVQILGPFSLPAFVSQSIGGRINDALAEKFDVTRLPVPLRLTGLTIEPGRILLSAVGSVEINGALPAGEALERTS